MYPVCTMDLMDYQGENHNQETKKNQRMTLTIGSKINGFMHFVNLHPLNSRTMTSTPIIATYALDTVHEDSPELDSLHLENNDTVIPYSVVP